MGHSTSITDWGFKAAKRTKTIMLASATDTEPSIEGDRFIEQFEDF